MICAQIIAEYEKQTELYERILKELNEIKTKIEQNATQNNDNFKDESPSRLLTIKETAKFLGISRSTIYNRISRHSEVPFPIKPKRFGRVVRFDRKDLEAYLDSM